MTPGHALTAGLTRHKLASGPTVLLDPGPNPEVLGVALCLPVGGIVEDRRTQGLSHFLEHAYDLGSERFPEGVMAARLASWGGLKNASTGKDATCFYASLPPSRLDAYLEMEADRFFNLQLPAEQLATEARVVLEERRGRVSDKLHGAVFEQILALIYPDHPYGFPLVGTEESVRGFDRALVSQFYQRHYVRNNLAIAISGGFEAEAALAAVQRRFGAGRTGPAWPEPPTPPRPHRPQLIELEAPDELGSVFLAWQGPPKHDPDRVYLDLLASILGSGRASRLARRLVREQRLAVAASARTGRHRQAGYVMLSAMAPRSVRSARLAEALCGEVERVRQGGVRPLEVAWAVERWQLGRAAVFQSVCERAQFLAKAEVTDVRGVEAVDADLACLEIPPRELCARVQAAAQRWLEPERRVQVCSRSRTEPTAPSKPQVAGKRRSSERLYVEGAPLDLTPPPGSAGPARLRAIPLPDAPCMAFALAFDAGSCDDPEGLGGLAALTARAVHLGAGGLSEDSLAVLSDRLGTGFSPSTDADATSFSGICLPSRFEAVLRHMASLLRQPDLPDHGVQRLVAESVTRRRYQRRSPGQLLVEAFYECLYPPEHPYRRMPWGRLHDLGCIERAHVQEFHAHHFVHSRLSAVVAGPLPEDTLRQAMQEILAFPPSATLPKLLWPRTQPRRRVVVVDVPELSQAHIRLGQVAMPRAHPDEPGWDALMEILSRGGVQGRLPRRLRVGEGLVYAVDCGLLSRRQAGPFFVHLSTAVQNAREAVQAVLEELQLVRAHAVPDDELKQVKGKICGSLPFLYETVVAQAGLALDELLHGEQPGSLDRRAQAIENLDPQTLHALTLRWLEPDNLAIAAVGSAEQLRPALAPFGEVEVRDPLKML